MMQKKPSVSWGTATRTRPLPAKERTATADPPDSVPELKLVLAQPASSIVAAVAGPARPRVAPTAPSTNNGGAGKPDAPLIVPQLSADEAAVAKQQTNQSLGIAEKNLAAAKGKSLSPAQTDLASKVRSFLSDARDAARAGDWIRARDLAKKAQVLSEELAGSL